MVGLSLPEDTKETHIHTCNPMWMYSNTHWKHVQTITSIYSRVLQALPLPRGLCTALDHSLSYTATFEPPPLEPSSPQVSLAQWWVILRVPFISLFKQSSWGLSSPWNSCLSDNIFCCCSPQCQTPQASTLTGSFPKSPSFSRPMHTRLPPLHGCSFLAFTRAENPAPKGNKVLHDRAPSSSLQCLQSTHAASLLSSRVLHVCTHVTITPILITLLLTRSWQPWKSQIHLHLLQCRTATQNHHTQLFSL